jgi:hypothetical protein
VFLAYFRRAAAIASACIVLLGLGVVVGRGASVERANPALDLFSPREALAVEAKNGASLVREHQSITDLSTHVFSSFAPQGTILLFLSDIILANKSASAITCTISDNAGTMTQLRVPGNNTFTHAFSSPMQVASGSAMTAVCDGQPYTLTLVGFKGK